MSSNLSVIKSPDGEVLPAADACEHYKFTVSYDGTLYWGFQRQNGCKTVQAELESALRTLGWTGTGIIGAGRTDRGVHAEGQVFSTALHWTHGPQVLRAAMNARLPEDISILNVEPVTEQFHARYWAESRVYRYRIYCSETREPLKDRFSWRMWPNLDLETLNLAASVLIGEHDFRAFGSPPRKNGTTIRRVDRAEWLSAGKTDIAFEVQANGFLYHMVRRMVFLQLMTVTERISWEAWRNTVLHAESTKPGMSPAKGLSLIKVLYKEP